VDHGVQLDHGEVQLGHGKPRVHAPEDLVHGGNYPDHGGKLLGYDGEGQLDGVLDEVEDRGHYWAEPDDEVPDGLHLLSSERPPGRGSQMGF